MDWLRRKHPQQQQPQMSNDEIIADIAAKLTRYATDGSLTSQQLAAINNLAADRTRLKNLVQML